MGGILPPASVRDAATVGGTEMRNEAGELAENLTTMVFEASRLVARPSEPPVSAGQDLPPASGGDLFGAAREQAADAFASVWSGHAGLRLEKMMEDEVVRWGRRMERRRRLGRVVLLAGAVLLGAVVQRFLHVLPF